MKINRAKAVNLIVAVIFFYSFPAFADSNRSCRLLGSYGYLYNGTSYTGSGPVPLTETGFFTVDNNGNFTGEGKLNFYFSNFDGSGRPLWLLIREIQSSGVAIQESINTCTGTINFLATGTVIKTSNANLVAEGTVLYTDSERSLAYTISGSTVNMISTSPDTMASGTGQKQQTRYFWPFH